MNIKKRRVYFLFAPLVIAVCAVLFFGVIFFTALFSDGKYSQYKRVSLRELSVYDPYIFRKMFIPMPEKKGLLVELQRISTASFIETVLAAGTWQLSFANDRRIIAETQIGVGADMRAVFSVPEGAIQKGYNSIFFTPVAGRDFYIAYIGLLNDPEQAVVPKSFPQLQLTGYYVTRNPNASQHDITGVIGYFEKDDGESIHLQARSISELDVLLLAIVTNKGKTVAVFPENTVVETVRTSSYYLTEYSARRVNNKNIDLHNLYLQYRYIDDDEKKVSKINPFKPYDDEVHYGTEIHTMDNLELFDFVYEDSGIVTFEGNEIRLDRMLFVPPGKRLVLRAGQTIDLSNGASIVCRGGIDVKGTREAPVRLISSDSTGQGLVVLQSDGRCKIEYLISDNLGEVRNGVYTLTGCITFYEADVDFLGCSFLNNRSEDGLNILRADFSLVDCTFSNTFQDAFDADFCTGYFERCHFERTGNDALDVSTSQVKVLNCTFRDIDDKGISIGEASTAYLENIDVVNAQVVVGVKDNSVVTGKNLRGENVFIGYVAYQKKPEFGHSKTEFTNFRLEGKKDFDYLIEQNEVYFLDGKQKLPRSKKKEALIIKKLINEEPIT